MLKKVFITLFLCIALALSARISEKLLTAIAVDGEAPLMIEMKGHADLSAAHNMTHIEKGRFIVKKLMKHARESQREVIQILKQYNVPFESFWISNSIGVFNATQKLIDVLMQRDDIEFLAFNPKVKIEFPKPKPRFSPRRRNSTTSQPIEWNVRFVSADKLWEMGYRGKGIVVGGADTGVEFTHEALLPKYRGVYEWGIQHDYNWFDGVRSEEFRGCQRPRYCDATSPIDLEGHGTHTIGTAIGSSPYEYIGMSPESKWIACRFYSGYWNANTIIRCLQFFLAPTNVRGENPNPDLRPDVSVHSYGCITPSLCPDGNAMKEATKALRTAGHFMAVAAHNYGPACRTLRFEPGTHEHVFTCGATGQETHTIAQFSGRGPVPGIKNVKPDVTGPGENVYSSVPGNKYEFMSGTSMAAPGVAGVVALLWSAVPQLKNNVDLTEAILRKTAYSQETDECTEDGIYQSPNPVYGYGSIDALRAYDAAMKLFKKN